MTHEAKDIQCRTYLTSAEYLALKACREQMGLSESAFLRMAAMRLVDFLCREELCRSLLPDDRSGPGRV